MGKLGVKLSKAFSTLGNKTNKLTNKIGDKTNNIIKESKGVANVLKKKLIKLEIQQLTHLIKLKL